MYFLFNILKSIDDNSKTIAILIYLNLFFFIYIKILYFLMIRCFPFVFTSVFLSCFSSNEEKCVFIKIAITLSKITLSFFLLRR